MKTFIVTLVLIVTAFAYGGHMAHQWNNSMTYPTQSQKANQVKDAQRQDEAEKPSLEDATRNAGKVLGANVKSLKDKGEATWKDPKTQAKVQDLKNAGASMVEGLKEGYGTGQAPGVDSNR